MNPDRDMLSTMGKFLGAKAMSMKISRRANTVVLTGIIDETADFKPLLAESEPLHIDFSGIQRINSIGIRSWMRFLTDWQDKALVYEECPIVISEQIALLPSLRGIKKRCATIAHAVLPAGCVQCGSQEDVRLERADVVPNLSAKASPPRCAKCGGVTEWDCEELLEIFK